MSNRSAESGGYRFHNEYDTLPQQWGIVAPSGMYVARAESLLPEAHVAQRGHMAFLVIAANMHADLVELAVLCCDLNANDDRTQRVLRKAQDIIRNANEKPARATS